MAAFGDLEAVVGLFDEETDLRVRQLWAELEREVGLQGVYAAPYPHVTFHAARDYPDNQVAAALESVAKGLDRLAVRTGGIGVFTGPAPILYLPVARSEALTDLHRRLYERLAPIGSDNNPHYHPDKWLPHITVAMSDLDPESLAQTVSHLSDRVFDWQGRINRLALVYTQGQEQGIRLSVPPEQT